MRKRASNYLSIEERKKSLTLRGKEGGKKGGRNGKKIISGILVPFVCQEKGEKGTSFLTSEKRKGEGPPPSRKKKKRENERHKNPTGLKRKGTSILYQKEKEAITISRGGEKRYR